MRAFYRNPGALKSSQKKLKGNTQAQDSQLEVAPSSAAFVSESQEQNVSECRTEPDGDDHNSDCSQDFVDNGMGRGFDSDEDLFGDDGPDDPGSPDSPDESQSSESECLGPQPQRKRYSVGKSHGAFVSLGRAKATVARAHNLIEHQNNLQQDIARVVFSHYGRGNNVGSRHL